MTKPIHLLVVSFIASLLLLLGCSDDGNSPVVDAGPDTTCTDGQTEEEVCGAGTRIRTCVGETWRDWGECSDTSQRFIAISGDAVQRCALRGDGKAMCWVNDVLRESPDDVFVGLSNGGSAACGVKANRTLRCWGYFSDTEAWRDFGAPSGSFSQIEVMRSGQRRLGCGILRDSSAISCWDDDGNEVAGPLAAPVGSFVDLSLYQTEACSVATDNSINCWGDIAFIPPPTNQASKISIGIVEACVLDMAGLVQCWRYGPGTEYTPSNLVFQDLDLTHDFTGGCALTMTGVVQCFDRDGLIATPAQGPFSQLSGSCGILENGQIRCWGGDRLCTSGESGIEPTNACGSCGELPYQPQATCSCGGTFECNASGSFCTNGDESVQTATQLAATDDTVDAFTTITKELDVYGIDWYQVRVEDKLTGIMQPSFELTLPEGYSADLCIFYIEDAEESRTACGEVPPIQFMGKSVGACCKVATGGQTATRFISTGLGDTTNWTLMAVQYRGGPDDCPTYTLRYSF